jgi:hypothetical protein
MPPYPSFSKMGIPPFCKEREGGISKWFSAGGLYEWQIDN